MRPSLDYGPRIDGASQDCGYDGEEESSDDHVDA